MLSFDTAFGQFVGLLCEGTCLPCRCLLLQMLSVEIDVLMRGRGYALLFVTPFKWSTQYICMSFSTPALDCGKKRCKTWLILPVVICLSQRLSHACLSMNSCFVKLRMAHYISYGFFGGKSLYG